MSPLALADLRSGVGSLFLFVLLGLALDLFGLRGRPFRWIETTARRVMGRMFITHLTIVLGMFALASTESPAGLFGVFVVLKTLVDLSRWLPDAKPSAREELRRAQGEGTVR